MKGALVRSDYSTTKLSLIQTDDGDIVIKTMGTDEFRIATSGGQYHGENLVNIVNKFSELIDLLGNRCVRTSNHEELEKFLSGEDTVDGHA